MAVIKEFYFLISQTGPLVAPRAGRGRSPTQALDFSHLLSPFTQTRQTDKLWVPSLDLVNPGGIEKHLTFWVC